MQGQPAAPGGVATPGREPPRSGSKQGQGLGYEGTPAAATAPEEAAGDARAQPNALLLHSELLRQLRQLLPGGGGGGEVAAAVEALAAAPAAQQQGGRGPEGPASLGQQHAPGAEADAGLASLPPWLCWSAVQALEAAQRMEELAVPKPKEEGVVGGAGVDSDMGAALRASASAPPAPRLQQQGPQGPLPRGWSEPLLPPLGAASRLPAAEGTPGQQQAQQQEQQGQAARGGGGASRTPTPLDWQASQAPQPLWDCLTPPLQPPQQQSERLQQRWQQVWEAQRGGGGAGVKQEPGAQLAGLAGPLFGGGREGKGSEGEAPGLLGLEVPRASFGASNGLGQHTAHAGGSAGGALDLEVSWRAGWNALFSCWWAFPARLPHGKGGAPEQLGRGARRGAGWGSGTPARSSSCW
jgi:hypothetical protein